MICKCLCVCVSFDILNFNNRFAPLKKSYDKSGQHIKKQRHITLPTKVHLVKAMVFPVVMYGWESWTIKKAER